MKWRGALVALALASAACTSLPDIQSDVCGNAVLEETNDEDCDTFVDFEGGSCRPAGTIGECHFDCRLNGDGSRAICPSGYGCAADGICRRPIDDAFQVPKEPFSTNVASWVSAVDFDGDERFDLISTDPVDQTQQARFHLHYFDDDAKLTETRTFPRVTTRPVPRKSDSKLTDLLFSNYRVGMLPGRHDRQWVPSAFSSYTVDGEGMAVVGVYRDFVGWITPFALVASLEEGPGIYVPSAETNSLAWLTDLPGTHRDLIGLPIAANVVEGAGSPCDEVILAFRGERSVRIFDLCEPGKSSGDPPLTWRAAEPIRQVIEIPYEIETQPLAADVDGDGHLDVIVGVTKPATPATETNEATPAQPVAYIAYGDGERFGEPSTLSIRFWMAAETVPVLVDTILPPPLAAGDFSDDGIADFVFPNVALASRPGALGELTYFPAAENRAAPWSMAQISDVNANDLPDVIAASEGAPGVTLLNGTGGPYLVATSLVTHGRVRALTIGDFDGDHTNDIAICEEGPPASGGDALSITFGTQDGIPLPAQIISEMSGVEQLGHYPEAGLDALFVTSMDHRSRKPTGRFTLFDGSPDRLPFAPYTLVPFSDEMDLRDSAALALTSGAFSGPGSSDVVAVGLDDDVWSLWLVPDIARGQTPPQLLNADEPEGVFPRWPRSGLSRPDALARISVAGVAADLDNDGRDESVWMMPENETGCALLVYRVDAPSKSAELVQHLSIDEPCRAPELAVGNLGEGTQPELLVSTGQPELSRRLRVLWNDGVTPLSLENSTLVGPTDGEDVRGFSIFPGGKPRIAYVTASALYQVSTRTDGRVYDNVERLQKFNDARSVVVTDPNGDSFSDIVVADAEGLWMLKAALQ